MMFASIQSKDIPWRAGQRIETVEIRTEPSVHLVRREFRQHNEPNPILTSYRRHRNDARPAYVVNSGTRQHPFGRRPTVIEHWLIQMQGAEVDPVLTEIGLGVRATPEQIAHARRVLTRLANLAEKES